MRRPSAPVLVFVAVTILAASCASPQYRYVRDTHTRTAFRVPTTWTIFDKATVLGLPPGPQPAVPDPIQWLVGIDGDPQASVSHILNVADLTTPDPQGIGLVQALSFTERDSASISYLRNFLFPVDQLIQNGSDGAIVSYNDKLVQGGLARRPPGRSSSAPPSSRRRSRRASPRRARTPIPPTPCSVRCSAARARASWSRTSSSSIRKR